MASRPPRKCSIVGEGIVTFGVRFVTDLRNSKSATWIGLTCRTGAVTFITGGANSTLPCAVWNFTAIPPLVSTPASCSRKSMWKYVRRNSPSVIPAKPASSWKRTMSRIALSSASRSAGRGISPLANRSRAARSSDGRRKLPTWSARKGGAVRNVMTQSPEKYATSIDDGGCRRCQDASRARSVCDPPQGDPVTTNLASAKRVERLDQVTGRAEDLLAQLPVPRQLGRVHANVLDLRRLQTSLLDDLELLVARIDDGVRLLGVDDREDGHVAIADDESHVLIRDLAECAQPLHPLWADLDLQHVGEAYPGKHLVARKGGLQQQIDDVLRLAQKPGTQQI